MKIQWKEGFWPGYLIGAISMANALIAIYLVLTL